MIEVEITPGKWIKVKSLAELAEFLPDEAVEILRRGQEAMLEGEEAWRHWRETEFKPNFTERFDPPLKV